MDNMLAASGEPLPEPLAQRLRAELQAGEVVVWAGQPLPGLATRGVWIFSIVGGVMLVPAAIMAVVVGGIFLVVAIAAKSVCLGLFLVPLFVVFCLMIAMLVALPLRARSVARNTVYALTDRRAIVWQKGLWAFAVRSFGREQLAAMQRVERADGTGDLIFEQHLTYGSHGHPHTRSVGFLGIARVRDVEELIRATLLTPPKQGA